MPVYCRGSDRLEVSGTGCDPGEIVNGRIWMTPGGAPPVDVVDAAAADGSFELTLTVPTDYPLPVAGVVGSGQMGIGAFCGTTGAWDFEYRFLSPREPAPTTTTAKVKPKKVRQGTRAKVVIKVGTQGEAVGTLRVKVRGKAARLVPLRASDAGKRIVRLPRLEVGRYRAKVRFLGDVDWGNSRAKAAFRVVRRR